MPTEDDSSSKSIFDLTDREADARLQLAGEELKKKIYAKGLPIVYKDERCPTKHHYIEEYEDGRIHLVLFEVPTRKYIFVKDLTLD